MFTISHSTPDAPALLQVAGDLTIYDVQQAHEQLKALLSANSDTAWHLDLSGVAELDSAGAQLLLVLHQSLAAGGQSPRVIAASPSVIELAGLLALDALHPIAPVED